tara:strand:- start:884 stop:2350 length:1467 start_codon:yes stop_codon:yes gene_type:complete
MQELIEKKKVLNRENANLKVVSPIKIIQFGEGNFLRAFIGYAFQELNKAVNFNAGIAVVQPIDKGLVKMLNDQDGLYTLFMKGVKKGEEIQEIELIDNIVKCVDPYLNFKEYLNLAKEESLEFIISNTTEAGIAYVASDTSEMQPPSSFPAKLTLLLHERFTHFKGDKSKGLTIIPCELINHNSETLREIILTYISDWNLGDDFKTWILESNSFHSTLVDRIVPGYPRAEIEEYNAQLDYKDNLIVSAEAFLLWVIEGGEELKAKLPFEKTKLDVKIVDDMQPFRTRKVRILNGAHTSLIAFSYLYGNKTVKESVDNEFTGGLINQIIFDEIIPTLDFDKDQIEEFAHEILDRFRNPFIKHNISSLALNCISKFKVRVLPSILEYIKIYDKLPTNLTFAFAALIRFYKGTYHGESLPIDDNKEIIENFVQIWKHNDYTTITNAVLSNEEYWGEDLTKVKNLSNAISFALEEIDTNGVEKGFENFNKKY